MSAFRATAGASDYPMFVKNDEHGVPWCTYDECPSYDGKRCRQVGMRPHGICEPAVREMARQLKSAREDRDAFAELMTIRRSA